MKNGKLGKLGKWKFQCQALYKKFSCLKELTKTLIRKMKHLQHFNDGVGLDSLAALNSGLFFKMPDKSNRFGALSSLQKYKQWN